MYPLHLIFTVVLMAITFLASGRQFISNGAMESGEFGTSVLPASWLPLYGTPDHCFSGDNSCPTIKTSPGYSISKGSPQGGAWIRFFNASSHNERFGQELGRPMRTGCSYTLSFYCAYSKLNATTMATSTTIEVGFSKGVLGDGDVGIGQGNYVTVPMKVVEEWQFFEVTFAAEDDFDYISFGKYEVDGNNACYIDDVHLTEECELSESNSSSWFNELAAPRTRLDLTCYYDAEESPAPQSRSLFCKLNCILTRPFHSDIIS